MWSRIHLIPLLQAEEDRDQVRRHFADQAREKELLGTETSPYHSDRYAISFYCISLGFELWEWLENTKRRFTDSSAQASHIPPAMSLNSELQSPEIKERQSTRKFTSSGIELLPAVYTILDAFHLLQSLVGFQSCVVQEMRFYMCGFWLRRLGSAKRCGWTMYITWVVLINENWGVPLSSIRFSCVCQVYVGRK